MPPLSDLLLRSTHALRKCLAPQTRLLSLDVTTRHVMFSISDKTLTTAAPFGALSRTSTPQTDARILASCLPSSLDVGALIISTPPSHSHVVQYVTELLQHDVFPDLHGVLFISEPHAVAHCIDNQSDILHAMHITPAHQPRRKRRFFDAINPQLESSQLSRDLASRARISATDALQFVLDQWTNSNTTT